MFQQKNVRIYGQLIMFSLLQVVVAALLNDSLEFGVLLIVYMVVAVAGVALFFVFREVGRTGAVTPSRRVVFRRMVPQTRRCVVCLAASRADAGNGRFAARRCRPACSRAA